MALYYNIPAELEQLIQDTKRAALDRNTEEFKEALVVDMYESLKVVIDGNIGRDYSSVATVFGVILFDPKTPEKWETQVSTLIDKYCKNIYWGPTKLELLCISIQIFDREHFAALDTDIMMNVVNQVIPDIKKCRPRDIRLSHAINHKTAFENASGLLNEAALSEGSLIYGEMGAGFDGITVYFSLSMIVGGGRKDLVTIMQKSTSWSANLKVKGADVEIKDDYGETALIKAAEWERDEIVSLSSQECKPVNTQKIKRCLNCNAVFEDGQLHCSNCGSKNFLWE